MPPGKAGMDKELKVSFAQMILQISKFGTA